MKRLGAAADRPSVSALIGSDEKPAPSATSARWAILALLGAELGLAYVLFRPVSHNFVLYSVFALLGMLAVIVILRRRPAISKELLAIGLLVAGLAFYGTFVGHDNPGLLFTFLVFFAAPVLFFTLGLAATHDAIFWFLRAAAVVTIGLSVLLILFVAGEAEEIPQLIPDWLVEQTGLGATFGGGGSQARAYGLSSLAALGPLWMSSLVLRRDALLPHWSIRLLCALSAMAAAFVSSRMAILLVIVLAPVLAVVVKAVIRPRPFPQPRYRSGSVALVTLGAAAASIAAIFVMPKLVTSAPLVTLSQAIGSFFTGRASNGDADQSIRSDQAAQLIDAWSANPIFGAGFGARVPGYARTSERPWVLELQYHLLLFETGLVGILFIVGIAVCVFLLIRRAARTAPALLSSLTVVTVTGIAMLIANATNPYLQAPGHFWAIFLPLALANLVLGTAGRDTGPTVMSAHPDASR